MNRRCVLLTLGLALGLGFAQPAALSRPNQAQRGMALIQQQCAACHGARLEGRYGPPLSGPRFLGHWGGRSAEELRRYILARMPLGQPGTLTPQQTLDLLVYLLQANGLPSGEQPLAPQDLEPITLPKP